MAGAGRRPGTDKKFLLLRYNLGKINKEINNENGNSKSKKSVRNY